MAPFNRPSQGVASKPILPTLAVSALLVLLAPKLSAQTMDTTGTAQASLPVTEVQENVNANKFNYALEYALNAHNEDKSFTQVLEFSPVFPLSPELPAGFKPLSSLVNTTCQLPSGLGNYSLYVWANPDTKKVVAFVVEKNTVKLYGSYRTHLVTGDLTNQHPWY